MATDFIQRHEAVVSTPEDDPIPVDGLEDTLLADAENVLSGSFECGRDFDGTDHDGDGVRINTRPDPGFIVYEKAQTYVIALTVPLPEPHVFWLATISHDDVAGFMDRLTHNIEEDYDGIETVDVVQNSEAMSEARDTITTVAAHLGAEAA